MPTTAFSASYGIKTIIAQHCFSLMNAAKARNSWMSGDLSGHPTDIPSSAADLRWTPTLLAAEPAALT